MHALDELGWLQFQRLCELVLQEDAGIDPVDWEGSADAVRAAVSDKPVQLADRTLEPPVLLRCVWLRSGENGRRLPPPPESGQRSVLTCVNAGAGELGPLPDGHAIYGERELLDAIRRLPSLRMRLPSVLSLDAVPADPDALARSTFDLDAARALATVFVPTPAWDRAVKVLETDRFLVLTGPPEMGKTAIARMLGLALLADGWEVHECTRPEQVFGHYDEQRAQLFVADDAFGSTEYRADSAERWAADLGRILRITDDRHWLIWTSRPAPLRAGLRRLQRARGGERFPRAAAVQVDASALGVEEKTLILFRHARAAALTPEQRERVCANGAAIVDHPHFTPERIRRFVARGAPADGIDRELSEPTEAMAASFAALGDEHRELLFALLDCPPTPVDERDLATALRRHSPDGLHHAPVELVERLADHFLRVL
jgi:hypothetical protein